MLKNDQSGRLRFRAMLYSVVLLMTLFPVLVVFNSIAFAQDLEASLEEGAELAVDKDPLLSQKIMDSSEVLGGQELEETVLEIYNDNLRLTSAVFGLYKNGSLYLPLQELSYAFGYYTVLENENNVAAGYVRTQDRSYKIDVQNEELTVKGEAVKLSPDDFLIEEGYRDDVYVSLDVFNQIWPVTLSSDYQALALYVQAEEKLPFEEMQERIERKKELLDRENEKQVDLPFLKYPYQLYSKPILTVAANTNYNTEDKKLNSSINAAGTSDLLYAQADYNVVLQHNDGQYNPPENIRLRFKRRDIYDGALPLDLQEVQWGDVNLSSRNLIGTTTRGRGITFNSRSDNVDNDFNLITIDGTGTPGWEVELFINGQLFTFGEVAEDGIYRFEDIEVGYGRNAVKVVLYGPLGQVIEKNEDYYFASNALKGGDFSYNGGVLDQNKDLIPINEDRKTNRENAEGLASNIYGAYGLTDNITVFGSAYNNHEYINNKNIDRKYITAGAIGKLKNHSAQLEIYKQLGEGHALDLDTSSTFKGFKINTETISYKDFENAKAGFGNSAKKFEFDINIRKLVKTAIGSIGLDVGMDYTERQSGAKTTRYNTRQAFNVRRTNVSNTTTTNYTDGVHTKSNGALVTSSRFRQISMRNSLNYDIYPDVELKSVSSTLRYNPNDDYSAALVVNKSLTNDGTALGLSLTKDFDKYLGSVNMNWTKGGGTTVGVRVSTNLGPYGPNGDYIISSDPLRTVGPIEAFTYRDLDYDGYFTEGDIPERGTRVAIGNRITLDETDESGTLLYMGGGSGRAQDVTIDQASVDDPYLVSLQPGYSIYPRPGVVHKIQFPLIETGAIDGTITMLTGRPVAGLEIELMNDYGDIVQKTITAFDGYFTFERIPPGDFTIRASPETGLNIPYKYVSLTPDNLFQFGNDISVTSFDDPPFVDLSMRVANFDDNAVMRVDRILSLAKGITNKKKSGMLFSNMREVAVQKTEMTEPLLSPALTRIIENASGDVEPANDNVEEPQEVPEPINQSQTNLSPMRIQVTDFRMGQHPDKMRLVVDFSDPVTYKTNIKDNIIEVDLTNVAWDMDKDLQKMANSMLASYAVEKTETGTKLLLAMKEGAVMGASGLLKADAGKKDRLYIDIALK